MTANHHLHRARSYLLLGENERRLDPHDLKLKRLRELGSSHLSWLVQYIIGTCDLLRERARAGAIDIRKFREASEAHLLR